MHVWWYGLVCTSALMDVNQGDGDEDDDKRKNYLGGKYLLVLQVWSMCWQDKLHCDFS
jgi:hypothetical protein